MLSSILRTPAASIGSEVADATLTRPDPAGTGGHLLVRVREHIDRCLGDPALSPETIARAHRISGWRSAPVN
ncbi:hypothetical protein ABZT04_25775 [Streptomyces sp. NPDC005492]|uniref:hypothetical protein n=1 Tax=Streptomyces sp. NPDC005492 TaxID=3156883 RepID=UPI0033A087B1